MDYETLLKRARKNLPESIYQAERFEVPKVLGRIEGNKTIISNFQQICNTLGRPIEHLTKYLLKELATPGEQRGGRLILGTKVAASRINEKIRQYVKEFVICSTCGKPDTQIVKEGNRSFVRCQACGAKRQITSKI